MRRLTAGLAACILLAGCSDDDRRSESEPRIPTRPTTQTPGTTEAPTTTGAAPATTTFRVYFLQGGKLAATSRTVARTPAVGRAALESLAVGPNEAERGLGFTTACSAGELEGVALAIADGEATVTPRLEGTCGGQVAWTLLQFPTVRRVNGADRAGLERFAPAILVDSPAPFAAVSSPIRVTGTANTFEANLQYELLDAGGKKLAQHFATATSGTGTRGTFDFTVAFAVDREVDGELVVYESSAEDGSRINVRRIPLRLEPA